MRKLSNGWTDWPPNVAHICRSIWEWIYTPNKLPLETQWGHLGGGGFRGQTFKSLEKLSNGWTDWHQLWFTSADSSGNGHRLNPSRPSIPQGHLGGGGGLGGHKFKCLGKLSNGWTDWHSICYKSADSFGNRHRLNTIRPTIPHGGILGGFRGSTIQKPRKCGQTAGSIWNKFCTYNASESGNGHRLNKLAP